VVSGFAELAGIGEQDDTKRGFDHGPFDLSDFERGIGEAVLEVERLGAQKSFLHATIRG